MRSSSGKTFVLADVEQVLPLKSWWAIVLVLPVVRRLVLLTVNYTSISPNAITITSLLLRLVAAGAFLAATRESLLFGAATFYLAYVLDCMDGAVARLKKTSSEVGRFLDHMGDLVGGILMVAALAAGQDMLWTPLVAGLVFVHLAESYISYLTSSLLAPRKGLPATPPAGFWDRGLPGFYVRYRAYFHRRNVKSFLSFPDYEATIFVLFPLLENAARGLSIGFYVAIVLVLYTILSTFVALHAGGSHFP